MNFLILNLTHTTFKLRPVMLIDLGANFRANFGPKQSVFLPVIRELSFRWQNRIKLPPNFRANFNPPFQSEISTSRASKFCLQDTISIFSNFVYNTTTRYKCGRGLPVRTASKYRFYNYIEVTWLLGAAPPKLNIVDQIYLHSTSLSLVNSGSHWTQGCATFFFIKFVFGEVIAIFHFQISVSSNHNTDSFGH